MSITLSELPASVPPLEDVSHARHVVGECPRRGWYPIECAGEYPLEAAPERLARGHGRMVGDTARYVEILDSACFEVLCANFNPEECAGSGVRINENHFGNDDDGTSDIALGFVRALATDGEHLYGYLDLTAEGHKMVNERAFWATSTEYKYADFEYAEDNNGKRYYSPMRLDGLALTNTPCHVEQLGLAQHNNNIMKKKQTPVSRHNMAEKKTESAATPATGATEKNTNPENSPTEENMESESIEELYKFMDVIAGKLGIPEDDEFSPEDVLEKIEDLIEDKEKLAKEVEDLSEEVAAMSQVSEQNSSRRRLTFRPGRRAARMNSNRSNPSAAAPSGDLTQRRRAAVAAARAANKGNLSQAQHDEAWNSVKS